MGCQVIALCILSFIVTWPLKVAVTTLRCQNAFGVICCQRVITLRCHLYLYVIILSLRPNDGRKPK